jgi:hypothetical protein
MADALLAAIRACDPQALRKAVAADPKAARLAG